LSGVEPNAVNLIERACFYYLYWFQDQWPPAGERSTWVDVPGGVFLGHDFFYDILVDHEGNDGPVLFCTALGPTPAQVGLNGSPVRGRFWLDNFLQMGRL
jgi:hypothetical protein